MNYKFKITRFALAKARRVNSRSGFTLIEVVVATAVFAFIMVSILGVYTSAIKLDRKSRSQRAVAQNARFIMEFLAKEVRNGRIDYASFPGGTTFSIGGVYTDLYLENQADIIEHIYLSGTNLILNKNGTSTNMNSAQIKVTKLQFYIQPVRDPYTVAKTYNEQPRVTVVLELTSNYGTAASEITTMNLQDTYAIRTYPSRLVAASGLTVRNVVWTNAAGVTITGNNLSKPIADNWGDSGAASSPGAGSPQSFASGDGYIEFSTSESNKYKLAGLSHDDNNKNYAEVDYAIDFGVGGDIYIFENGVNKVGQVGTYAPGDVFRIAVVSGTVRYYKNGSLLYTSGQAPIYPLFFDTALYSLNSTITNAQIAY